MLVVQKCSATAPQSDAVTVGVVAECCVVTVLQVRAPKTPRCHANKGDRDRPWSRHVMLHLTAPHHRRVSHLILFISTLLVGLKTWGIARGLPVMFVGHVGGGLSGFLDLRSSTKASISTHCTNDVMSEAFL